MLIGNVGAEPEVRYVEQGVPVAKFHLATTERGYTLQNGTQVPERTEWHNIVAWKRPAEYIEKFVHKGDRIFIEGQLRTRSYDDRNGVTRYVTEVWSDRVEVLSSPRSGQPVQAPTSQPAPASQNTAEGQSFTGGSDNPPF